MISGHVKLVKGKDKNITINTMNFIKVLYSLHLSMYLNIKFQKFVKSFLYFGGRKSEFSWHQPILENGVLLETQGT